MIAGIHCLFGKMTLKSLSVKVFHDHFYLLHTILFVHVGKFIIY